MKIAIITERANISLGGAERSVFELAARLSLMNSSVQILAATGTAHSNRVKILCGGAKRADFSKFKKALKAHFAENHYDIIHSTLPIDFADIYQPRGGTYPEAIIRNAASYGNPIISAGKVVTSFINLRRQAFSSAERKLCKNPAGPKIAALSGYVKKQLQKHYSLGDDRVTVVPNGVKIFQKANTAQTDKLKSQILEKLELKEADEPVLFLFAANNFRLKGLRNLIKAAAMVAKRHTKRKACIIVAGRDKPGPYRHLARMLKIKNHIVFLGQSPNIQNALSIADVAVLPTYYDPSSRFILEALALGKPVITTRYNGAADLFTSDRHGKVYDSPDDIDSLAEALRFFTNTENIEKYAQAIVSDSLDEQVSIKAHCQKLMVLYDSIVKEKTKK